MELNLKQKRFADEYIISGNATEAAIKAGYSKKYAGTNASKLLKNTTIKNYIEQQTAKQQQKLDYTIEQVIERLYQRALGYQEEKFYKEVDNLTNEVKKDTVKYVTPSEKEQNSAADMLLKLTGKYIEKQQIEFSGSVEFVDDIDESN